MFHTQLHACHVVGAVDDEKQCKGEQVHPDEDGYGVKHPACDVGEHAILSVLLFFNG